MADRIEMVRRWVNLNGQMWVAVLVLRSGDLSGVGGEVVILLKWLIDESKPCASNSSSY